MPSPVGLISLHVISVLLRIQTSENSQKGTSVERFFLSIVGDAGHERPLAEIIRTPKRNFGSLQ